MTAIRAWSRRPSSISATKLSPNSISISQSHGSIWLAFEFVSEGLCTNCLSFVLWERKTFHTVAPIHLARLSLWIAMKGRLPARKRRRVENRNQPNSIESHPEGKVAILINLVQPECNRGCCRFEPCYATQADGGTVVPLPLSNGTPPAAFVSHFFQTNPIQ